jgi:hypothetical protein
MAALGSRNSFRFSTVILNVAALALFAGCWLEKPYTADRIVYSEVSIQATVKNNISGALSVSLLPALGSRKKSAFQWAIGRREIGLAPDSFPTETADIKANSEQALRTFLGQSAEGDDNDRYDADDNILSFLVNINGDEYAGWGAQYGTGGRTLVAQGYGYAVLGDYGDYGGDLVVNWHSPLPAGKEYTILPAGSFNRVTVRYVITITDSGVEFVLDEVAYYLREYPTDFLEHDDPDGG